MRTIPRRITASSITSRKYGEGDPGRELGGGADWVINVDSKPYTHRVSGDATGTFEGLEDIVIDLAAKIAAGGYITSVVNNSIFITRMDGIGRGDHDASRGRICLG